MPAPGERRLRGAVEEQARTDRITRDHGGDEGIRIGCRRLAVEAEDGGAKMWAGMAHVCSERASW